MPRSYKDAFGVPISEGDVILSAATSGWTCTIGYARIRPNTLAVESVVQSGSSYYKIKQVGSWVVVLRKADGSVPKAIKPLTEERVFPRFDDEELPGMWASADLIGGETDNG